MTYYIRSLSLGLLFNLLLISASNATPSGRYIVLKQAPSPTVTTKLLSGVSILLEGRDESIPELKSEFENGGVISWNKMSQDIVALTKTNPPMASRAYALLSIAHYDTIRAAKMIDNESAFAATSQVSMHVLSYLFPSQRDKLKLKNSRALQYAYHVRNESRYAIARGRALGKLVAQKVIQAAKRDGADMPWIGQIPSGEGFWFSALPPLLPQWGTVKTWFLVSGDEIRPEAPPAFGSAEFIKALAEVRMYSDQRTPEQTDIAKYWAAGVGTSTPPGMWNKIAGDFLSNNKVPELKAATVFAAMNMAMMDAGVCAWDAKYTYWSIRPSQADPGITLPVGLPNFPAYVSGHATFSGAASTVLGTAFPTLKNYFDSLAEEAAMSRLYGGIHYRHDNEEGLKGGRTIGGRAGDWLKGRIR